MPTDYSYLCDDFYLDMSLNTELEVPTQRDTILGFFEKLQKKYPTMASFYRTDSNHHRLEEDPAEGHYRWVNLEPNAIVSGMVNPTDVEEAYNQHRFVLDLVPYMLSISHLDIDSLDVTYSMDFDYWGNHDEVIAEALFSSTAFACLLDLPAAHPVGFSPAVVVSLSEDNCTQARISVESKTSVYTRDKKSETSEDAITLSFTLRRYPSGSGKFDALKSFESQIRLAESLMTDKIIPNFVMPLTAVIARKGPA